MRFITEYSLCKKFKKQKNLFFWMNIYIAKYGISGVGRFVFMRM